MATHQHLVAGGLGRGQCHVLGPSVDGARAARAGAEISASRQAPANPQGIARLLGGGRTDPVTAASSAVASEFKLLGVVASPSETGYALIAVGALPAKPFRVGDAVDETLILQSVAPRSATLGATRLGPASQILELPPLARP